MKIAKAVFLLALFPFTHLSKAADGTAVTLTTSAVRSAYVKTGVVSDISGFSFIAFNPNGERVLFNGFLCAFEGDDENTVSSTEERVFVEKGTGTNEVAVFIAGLPQEGIDLIMFPSPVILESGETKFQVRLKTYQNGRGTLRIGLSGSKVRVDSLNALFPTTLESLVLPSAQTEDGTDIPVSVKNQNARSVFTFYKAKHYPVSFPVKVGQEYSLDYSTNLTRWIPYRRFTAAGDRMNLDWELPPPDISLMFLRLKPVVESP